MMSELVSQMPVRSFLANHTIGRAFGTLCHEKVRLS